MNPLNNLFATLICFLLFSSCGLPFSQYGARSIYHKLIVTVCAKLFQLSILSAVKTRPAVCNTKSNLLYRVLFEFAVLVSSGYGCQRENFPGACFRTSNAFTDFDSLQEVESGLCSSNSIYLPKTDIALERKSERGVLTEILPNVFHFGMSD